ncbi:4-alpha-glucanotransferase [Raphidocelis subcapitata]|uniref:4-alpha-glucanotransferase n=1 Tax=Raphidocelis subcapitata TaxID=307507 RepID=A0A2V0NWX7_9CHLO|nr:4-alpha-glucanotransferase [Raphidocelis subcapitata]|eukprot:GBF89315.1 4-alpha-glucanotransferase [Raphidocelis subcapitata]
MDQSRGGGGAPQPADAALAAALASARLGGSPLPAGLMDLMAGAMAAGGALAGAGPGPAQGAVPGAAAGGALPLAAPAPSAGGRGGMMLGPSVPQYRAPPSSLDKERRIHLHFRVSFLTKWGQSVSLSGSGALLGNFDFSRGVEMSCRHDREDLVWEALVSLPWQPEYKYRYAVVHRDEDGNVVTEKEETITRRVVLPEQLENGDVVDLSDSWVDRSYPGSILATAAFTKVIRRRSGDGAPAPCPAVPRLAPAIAEAIVRFKVNDLMLEDGEIICVTGAVPQLGTWQTDHMLQLTPTDEGWEGEIRVPYANFAFTYKYAVVTRGHGPTPVGGGAGAGAGAAGRGAGAAAANGPTSSAAAPPTAILHEVGEPRVAALPLAGSASAGAPSLIARHDGFFRRDKLWRGAGVALPVFSLRTRDSVGVGEFLDIKRLVDFAGAAGLRLIQILPVNDTCVYGSWWDSYPYSTLSVHALHPQYLALGACAEEGGALPAGVAAQIDEARQRLDLPDVDYEAVMETKTRLARAIFDAAGHKALDTPAFKEWFEASRSWLVPYAAFCFLRDLFGTAEHWRWGAMAAPTEELLQRITGPGQEWHPRIRCCYWVQWHLHRQLKEVSEYAASRRVALKGDLPIGVDKRSVDTWMQPRLFRMSKSTGAPPDVFDPNGQNWGFPTYDWEAMAEDGYAWWRSRLTHMAQYFHAYRIDHILGFCRIWEVPGDCATGLLGHFRPSNPITRRELESRGVRSFERLTQPYIRQPHLSKLFGPELAAEVAARYMVEDPAAPGSFHFRPQYESERAISEIAAREGSPDWLVAEVEATRRGLLALRQNVCLLRDEEDADAFYPRFNLMGSTSYRDLDPSQRAVLAQLHEEYFFRRQDDLWRAHALRTLPVLLGATNMLVCGEDLGFVPACLPPVMQELGLIGLRIQRMATQPGTEFNNPAGYPYLAVASPSCHDVAPLRAWYEEDADRRERFYYSMLGGAGPPPAECDPDIAKLVVSQHCNSPSALCILPVQDVLALSKRYCGRPAREEVINDPTKSKHYWRYRMQVSVEELLADRQLLELLQDTLLLSGRARISDLPELLAGI